VSVPTVTIAGLHVVRPTPGSEVVTGGSVLKLVKGAGVGTPVKTKLLPRVKKVVGPRHDMANMSVPNATLPGVQMLVRPSVRVVGKGEPKKKLVVGLPSPGGRTEVGLNAKLLPEATKVVGWRHGAANVFVPKATFPGVHMVTCPLPSVVGNGLPADTTGVRGGPAGIVVPGIVIPGIVVRSLVIPGMVVPGIVIPGCPDGIETPVLVI